MELGGKYVIPFLGRNSIYYWLLSGMFFLNTKELEPILTFPRYSILIFLWLFVMLTPFVFACSFVSDKILGLNLGADDYITKPFLTAELTARVRSSLRRYTMLGSVTTEKDEYVVGSISLNDPAKEVRVDGDIVNLTKTEYEILRLLIKEPGRVFSPHEIYRSVWGDDPYGTENTVAVHIRRLREKIEIDPAKPRYLKVIWGQGYKIENKS